MLQELDSDPVSRNSLLKTKSMKYFDRFIHTHLYIYMVTSDFVGVIM